MHGCIALDIFAADCDDGVCYRSLEATCRFQWAINAFALAGGDFMPFPFLDGWQFTLGPFKPPFSVPT